MANEKEAVAVQSSAVAAQPAAIGPLFALDSKDFERAAPLQMHPTEQHMITYTLSDDQLDFIESGGVRFTILSTISAFLWSSTLSCFLSGLTVPGTWTAAQYGSFMIAPMFSGVLAVAGTIWAFVEFKAAAKRKSRIKARSFEPGTPKTIKELSDV
jgi:hypothetical protein